jgi:hypothetical protein
MGPRTEYIVIGGGEWGCLHVELLLRAIRAGRLAPAPVVAVDRDGGCAAAGRYASEAWFRFERSEWLPFLVERLVEGEVTPDSQVVPSPHAPHLFLLWLRERLARERPGASLGREPFRAELSLPFQYTDADYNLYLSAAAWRCPLSCREPAVCPAIHARRSWELGDIIRARAGRDPEPMTPLIWQSRYFCPGVAGVPVGELLAGARALLEGPERGRAAVATVSSCHGVVGVLRYDGLGEGRGCA